jgi:hypothetical protein
MRETGKCELCGKPMVKHIIKEGARYHVTSWHGSENGATSHCSEPDCENNHGYGHCVPFTDEMKHNRRMQRIKANNPWV